jgi:hypothetical protein
MDPVPSEKNRQPFPDLAFIFSEMGRHNIIGVASASRVVCHVKAKTQRAKACETGSTEKNTQGGQDSRTRAVLRGFKALNHFPPSLYMERAGAKEPNSAHVVIC